MAILNIKNFPDDLYAELQDRAQRERRSVAQEAIFLLEVGTRRRALHSILELRGLGKEVWKGIDAAAHVEAERSSWDS